MDTPTQTDTEAPDTDEQLSLVADEQQENEGPDLAAQLAEAQESLQTHQSRAAELEKYETFVQALYSDDPEIRAVALEALGLDTNMNSEDDKRAPMAEEAQEAEQPMHPDVAAQLEDLQGWRNSREEADRAEQAYQQIVADSAPIFDEQNIPEQAREVILQTALNMPGVDTPEGPKPNIAGAVEELTNLAMTVSAVPAIRTAILNEYKNSKQAPAAPRGGAAGEQAPDLNDRGQRLAYMTSLLEDNQ